MMTGRRNLTITLSSFLILALFAAGYISPASGKEFPTKQIKIIIPFKMGGATDISIRKLQPYLQNELGVSILVENNPGGGGMAGTTAVFRAQPDGYTLLGQAEPTMTLGQLLSDSPTYDVNRFTYLYGWLSMPRVVAVDAKSQYKKFEDLLSESKKRTLNAAGVELGSSNHLQSVLLRKVVGLNHRFVPFGSGGQAIAAALGGHTDCVLPAAVAVKSFVNDKTIRVLAIHSEEPFPGFEGVPTLKELGYSGVVSTLDVGLTGPPGMEEQVVEILEKAIERAVSNPKYLEEAKKMDEPIRRMNRKQWTERIRELSLQVKETVPLMKADMETKK